MGFHYRGEPELTQCFGSLGPKRVWINSFFWIILACGDGFELIPRRHHGWIIHPRCDIYVAPAERGVSLVANGATGDWPVFILYKVRLFSVWLGEEAGVREYI